MKSSYRWHPSPQFTRIFFPVGPTNRMAGAHRSDVPVDRIRSVEVILCSTFLVCLDCIVFRGGWWRQRGCLCRHIVDVATIIDRVSLNPQLIISLFENIFNTILVLKITQPNAPKSD